MWQNTFSSRPFSFGGSIERRQSCLSLQTIRDACNRELRLVDTDSQSSSGRPGGGTTLEDAGTLGASSGAVSKPLSGSLLAREDDFPRSLLPLPEDPVRCARLLLPSLVHPSRATENVRDATREQDIRLFSCSTVHGNQITSETSEAVETLQSNGLEIKAFYDVLSAIEKKLQELDARLHQVAKSADIQDVQTRLLGQESRVSLAHNAMMESAAALADSMDRRLTAFESRLKELSRPVSISENLNPDVSGITSVSWRREQPFISNTSKPHPPQRFRKPRVLVLSRGKDKERLLRAIQRLTMNNKTFSCMATARPLEQ